MYRIPLFLCAQTIIRDAETNNLSLINLLEDITTETLPALLPNFGVLITFERDSGDAPILTGTLNITLNDEPIFDHGLTVNFLELSRTRQMINISSFPLPKPGLIKLKFEAENKVEATYFIRINEPRTQVRISESPGSATKTKRRNSRKASQDQSE
jgi:hypothetical protein